MHKSIVSLLCFALIVSHPEKALTTEISGQLQVQQLSEGIYVVIRNIPAGLAFDSNVVFIINEQDVFVIDTNFSLASAKEVLAELKKLTSKPVRYVINTHWHDDHITGNQMYRDAFPAVDFIGHVSSREDMQTTGASNRKQMIEAIPGFLKQLRDLLSENKNFAGQPLTEEERASYRSDMVLGERYMADASQLEIIYPSIVVERRLTFHRGERVINILHLGGGHTRADLVVHLPVEGILITGDLVVWPVPLVGSTSYPKAFANSLDRLLDLKADVIVPGHGPVMRDSSYLKLNARMLLSLVEQTKGAVARNETLEKARDSVNLDEFRSLIAAQSQLKNFIFQNYVLAPGVAAAYRELTEGKDEEPAK